MSDDIVEKNLWRFLLTLSPTVPANISILASDLFLEETGSQQDAERVLNNCIRNAQSNGWDLTRRGDTIVIDKDHYNFIITYYRLTGRSTEIFAKIPNCNPGALIGAIKGLRQVGRQK